MQVTERVRKILDHYESDNPGTKANLARILMQGKLGGTGKLVILPVDQGFEHGPARSFAPNPPAYDPHYHFQLAIDAGLIAYAAPARHDRGRRRRPSPARSRPSSRSTAPTAWRAPRKARPGGDRRASRTRCGSAARRSASPSIPGSDDAYDHDGGDRASWPREAKAHGLAVVIWSYPRGGNLSKAGETAIDICAYAAHMAALLGAHIIKVKPPTEVLELEAAKKVYSSARSTSRRRPRASATSCSACFNGKRIVVFSGGEAKDLDGVYNEVRAIRDGGGNGSIIGRNTFQRPREEALKMLDTIIRIYRGEGVSAADGGAALSHHPAGARPAGLRRRASPRRSTPAMSAACSSASRTSTTTRSAAPPTLLRPVAQARGVAFLMNDRPDLALATGCDGVHVGQEDAPYDEARRILGPDRIVGVTCYAQPRPRHGGGRGGRRLRRLRRLLPEPDQGRRQVPLRPRNPALVERDHDGAVLSPSAASRPQNCGPLVAAGADFLAVISAVWNHPAGPAAAVKEFLKAIAEAT